MSSVRTSRALVAGASAVVRAVNKQVSARATSIALQQQTRAFSLASVARQQTPAEKLRDRGFIAQAKIVSEAIKVDFIDGTSSEFSNLWLRDNCQCPNCFHKIALGRNFLMEDLKVDLHPTNIQETADGIKVDWNDGHHSEFRGEWLHQRSFTPSARQNFRNVYGQRRIPWGNDHTLPKYTYQDLMSDDKILLDWLLNMEKTGAAIVKNTPAHDTAGCELLNHIGFVKPTHYGLHSPVVNRPVTNNVAYSNAKLGLHNDLAQYEYMAGVIFIQCLKQHIGTGGESVVSDGLYAAEYLRRVHPEVFQTLTSTDVYFWDKGEANIKGEESESFYKIAKGPIIRLNNDREVVRISVNNQVRDSFLDLKADKVTSFYKAMKLMNDVLYENAINFKMEDGDMLTLDNLRCLHGREGYEATSERHIESTYIDWDEMLCRRRRLQEAMGLINLN